MLKPQGFQVPRYFRDFFKFMTIVVATFYKFVNLDNFQEKRQPLLSHCQQQGVKGTILLAQEGINGAIAGSPQEVESVLAYLLTDPRLADLEVKESTSEKKIPFRRLKVRLKKEIVTIGIPKVNPVEKVGTYVKPTDWNQIISDSEVTVIDTRNDYEVEIGTFKGAQNPNTTSFGHFPQYIQDNLDPKQNKKVALFCTGGIRCEKATSYLLDQGFEEVYHLKGGILKYLEEVPPEESLWEGECFVFDQRVTLKHGLVQGNYELCRGCGQPISEEDKQKAGYEAGVSCANCYQPQAE